MHKTLKMLTPIIGIAAFLIIWALGLNLLGALLLGLAVLTGYLADRARIMENQQKPITTVEATVRSHRTMRERVGRSTVVHYYISFRTVDGGTLEFKVSQMDFEDFDVGETGSLRYRGWEFLSFGVRDKSGVKPIAPLPEEYAAEPKVPASVWVRVDRGVKAFVAKLKPTKHEKNAEKPEEDDGILTHELDE